MGTLTAETKTALALEIANDFFKESFAACMCPNTRLWEKDGLPWCAYPEGDKTDAAFAVISGPKPGLTTFVYHYDLNDSQEVLNQKVMSAHLIGELSFRSWVNRGCKDEE